MWAPLFVSFVPTCFQPNKMFCSIVATGALLSCYFLLCTETWLDYPWPASRFDWLTPPIDLHALCLPQNSSSLNFSWIYLYVWEMMQTFKHNSNINGQTLFWVIYITWCRPCLAFARLLKSLVQLSAHYWWFAPDLGGKQQGTAQKYAFIHFRTAELFQI